MKAPDDEYRLDSEPIKCRGSRPLDEAFERLAIRGEHLSSAARHAIDHGPHSPVTRVAESKRMRVARDVFAAVVNAAYMGGAERDRWLSDVFTSLRHIELALALGLEVKPLSMTARRLLVIRAIKERRADFDEARALLREADEAFDKISDETLRGLFDKVSDVPGGAGHVGEIGVAAEAAVLAGALKAKRRTGEAHRDTIDRVARTFHRAQDRLAHANKR